TRPPPYARRTWPACSGATATRWRGSPAPSPPCGRRTVPVPWRKRSRSGAPDCAAAAAPCSTAPPNSPPTSASAVSDSRAHRSFSGPCLPPPVRAVASLRASEEGGVPSVTGPVAVAQRWCLPLPAACVASGGRSARMVSCSEPAGVLGDADGVDLVAGARLGDGARQVVADGAGGQVQAGGDLLRRRPSGGFLEYGRLARSQRALAVLHRRGHQFGVEHPQTVDGAP